MNWLRTTNFAHRGLHSLSEHCPENSMPAIEEAIDHGYGIEIDIQRSADNEAMVFHDLSLRRLTGENRLLTYCQSHHLKRIRICGTSARIATLKEILDFVKGQVPLLLEIKSAPGIPGMLEKRVAELIRKYPGPLAVMSWAPATVAALAVLAPDVPAGRIVSRFNQASIPEHVIWLQRKFTSALGLDTPAGRQFLACDIKSLLSENKSEVRKSRFPLLAWTIKSSQEAHSAHSVADAIIFEGFRP